MRCSNCGKHTVNVCLGCKILVPLCVDCYPQHWEEKIGSKMRDKDTTDLLGSIDRHSKEWGIVEL